MKYIVGIKIDEEIEFFEFETEADMEDFISDISQSGVEYIKTV